MTALMPFRVLWRRHGLERGCSWTRQALERYQERRVAQLRHFAVERSPFYHRFHRGGEGQPLHRLPILTKALMMEHFDELVTDRAVRLGDAERYLEQSSGQLFLNRYVVLSTSGSTGRRGLFLFNHDEWVTALAMISRPMAWARVTTSPDGTRRRPRTAMVASTTPWHYSTRVSASLSSRLLPSLRLDAADPLDVMVGRLNEWKPDVLAAYPSVLRQLADEQLAGRLRIQPDTIATSAEVLTVDTRSRVREAWGVRVYDTYGATEYAPIAAECAFGRKHLVEDGAVIEVVDERGNPVPDGESGDRILLTVFDRRTQPLIRYEISDMVRPAGGACECGRPFRLIDAIEGRQEDVLQLPGIRGTAVDVHPNVFHRALETVPASGWQVQQDGNGLFINLTGLRDLSLMESVRFSVQRELEGQAVVPDTIHVRVVTALTRGATGKAPLVMADRTPARQAARVHIC